MKKDQDSKKIIHNQSKLEIEKRNLIKEKKKLVNEYYKIHKKADNLEEVKGQKMSFIKVSFITKHQKKLRKKVRKFLLKQKKLELKIMNNDSNSTNFFEKYLGLSNRS